MVGLPPRGGSLVLEAVPAPGGLRHDVRPHRLRHQREQRRYFFLPYKLLGVGMTGALSVMQGDVEEGVEMLTESLIGLNDTQYGTMTSELQIYLAENRSHFFGNSTHNHK